MKITVAQIIFIIDLALAQKDKDACHACENYLKLGHDRSTTMIETDMAGKESKAADAVFGGVAQVARAVRDFIEDYPDSTSKDVRDLVWNLYSKAADAVHEDKKAVSYWRGSLNMPDYITASRVYDTCFRLHYGEQCGIEHVYNAIMYTEDKLCGTDQTGDLDDDEIKTFETYAASLGI